MSIKFSKLGDRFTEDSGISSLMRDLGAALQSNSSMIFMGGGNPAQFESVNAIFAREIANVTSNKELFNKYFGTYQSPEGHIEFRKAVSSMLSKELNAEISIDNIAISNGSQSAFFIIFNLLAGKTSEGKRRSILLPMLPEYIGYTDIGLEDNFFVSQRPKIKLLENRFFKYEVDFDNLVIGENIAALCVSRPTNPTGNMLTIKELQKLDVLAKASSIPLIIDCAYGLPFPGVVYGKFKQYFSENTILVYSLAKLGLPGCRTGIIVGNSKIIDAFNNANVAMNLATSSAGPAVMTEMMKDNKLLPLCKDKIMPKYKVKLDMTLKLINEIFIDLNYRIHVPEGAFFIWFWFKDLPISSTALYEKLKKEGVLVIPGDHFFPGVKEDWSHSKQCIRVSYTQDAESISKGLRIIYNQIKKLY